MLAAFGPICRTSAQSALDMSSKWRSGYYTIDAATAAQVTDAIKPLIAIPMHYRTACSADMPIATEEAYLSMMRENEYAISALSSTQLELDPEDMPRARRVVLMEYK